MKRNEPIDWAGLRARIEQVRKELAEDAVSPGERERIFHQRAELLARGAAPAASPTEDGAILVIRLGEELYGIPLSRASEVIMDAKISLVPGAPPQIAGVVQVRGEIRPVYDLARLLHLPESAGSDTDHVVLLTQQGREIGLRTGAVEDVRHIAPADRRPAPSRSPRAIWLTADLVTVLNMDLLLEGES